MKTKIIRENGYYWNARSGVQYLWENNAAAHRRAMYRGEVKPTFRYQYRRFWRLLRGRLREIASDAVAYLEKKQRSGMPTRDDYALDLETGRIVIVREGMEE